MRGSVKKSDLIFRLIDQGLMFSVNNMRPVDGIDEKVVYDCLINIEAGDQINRGIAAQIYLEPAQIHFTGRRIEPHVILLLEDTKYKELLIGSIVEIEKILHKHEGPSIYDKYQESLDDRLKTSVRGEDS